MRTQTYEGRAIKEGHLPTQDEIDKCMANHVPYTEDQMLGFLEVWVRFIFADLDYDGPTFPDFIAQYFADITMDPHFIVCVEGDDCPEYDVNSVMPVLFDQCPKAKELFEHYLIEWQMRNL